MKDTFNPDDKIKRAFPFYAFRERVSEMRIPSDVYIHLKTEYVLELGNEIRPLTLLRGLFSYAGRTFGAEYDCDPHSMFTLNADLDDKRGNIKIEHMAVKYLRKDRHFLILFLNEKFLEKLSPKQHVI